MAGNAMTNRTYAIARTLAFCSLAAMAAQAGAQRGNGGARGGGQARASAGTHHRSASTHHANRSAAGTHSANRTNVNHANVNRNVNNVNVNRNVNVNTHGGYGYGYGAHPVARGAVAGATAAVVMGSYYRTLPAGCSTMTQAGIVYHHCGSTWYKTEGSQYLVVPQP